MVCEGRDDLHNSNLSLTKRLILEHIGWRVSMIADPKEIESYYVEAVKKNYSDYPDFYPESDYPDNYPESDYESDNLGFFEDCDAKTSAL